jgi:hypothetical protein
MIQHARSWVVAKTRPQDDLLTSPTALLPNVPPRGEARTKRREDHRSKYGHGTPEVIYKESEGEAAGGRLDEERFLQALDSLLPEEGQAQR